MLGGIKNGERARPTVVVDMVCLSLNADFFLHKGVVVTEENVRSSTFVAEIGGMSSFEHLELVSKNVLLPVLTNQTNQLNWGDLTSREVAGKSSIQGDPALHVVENDSRQLSRQDGFHSFLSSSSILCGQVKAETRLPTPPEYDGGEEDDENAVPSSSSSSLSSSSRSSRISLLESTVVTWTKQIKDVLKQDPETQLKLGLHPTPDVEVLFWKEKSDSLDSIFDQLQSPSTRRVLRALDKAKSTYCTTFARLCKEVYSARLEANDNAKKLRTLDRWINKLNDDDFTNLRATFKPILHTVMLIWKHSKYYNTPSRLVVLIREMCNSVISQGCRFVSGEQIFSLIDNEEANVAVEQLVLVLEVCGSFKKTYQDYKRRVADDCPDKQWAIQNDAMFARLDRFVERAHDILELTRTVVQFTKLAKVEIGGTKGGTLTSSVHKIQEDFQRSVDKVKGLEYDIMDINATQFDAQYSAFRKFVKEIERRLGAVIGLALDDCETVYGRFQIVDTFDRQLLDRPIIQDEVEVKQIALIGSYGQDLKIVQEEFLRYRSDPPKETMRNLPPIGGALTWCRGLVARASIPMEKMQSLSPNILDREEAKEVVKVQRAIMSSLLDYEKQKVAEWSRDVDSTSSSSLAMPLLRRTEETRHLVTNFDPALVRLLREVKYFLLLGLAVPESALDIYQSADTFRAWTGNLDLVVGMNNSVLSTVLPVEKPLVDPFLAKFDLAVRPGLDSLSWQSEGVGPFISEALAQVKVVHEILRTMKDNLESIQGTAARWSEKTMSESICDGVFCTRVLEPTLTTASVFLLSVVVFRLCQLSSREEDQAHGEGGVRAYLQEHEGLDRR